MNLWNIYAGSPSVRNHLPKWAYTCFNSSSAQHTNNHQKRWKPFTDVNNFYSQVLKESKTFGKARSTYPKHEGIDDKERFEAGYYWFGLHSPRCHTTVKRSAEFSPELRCCDSPLGFVQPIRCSLSQRSRSPFSSQWKHAQLCNPASWRRPLLDLMCQCDTWGLAHG